jgi:hypothetical protein
MPIDVLTEELTREIADVYPQVRHAAPVPPVP